MHTETGVGACESSPFPRIRRLRVDRIALNSLFDPLRRHALLLRHSPLFERYGPTGAFRLTGLD